MSLADDVIQQAAATQEGPSQTVGNAVQAYQIAQKAQADRQALEQKKQENEMNKSHWLLGQIDTIGRMPEGAARDLAIDSFGKQAPSVFPGFNKDLPTLFKRDPDMVAKANIAAQHYMDGGQFDPSALNQFATMETPDALKMINGAAENVTKLKAAQLAATSGRVAAMQDTATLGAVSKLHNDPTIVQGVKRGQAFDIDLDQLGKKPNWQTYNEVFQNYANSLAGAKGVVSDAKLHEMQTALSGPQVGKWSTYLTNHPDASGNEADPEAVKWLQTKLKEVSSFNDHQMGVAANRKAALDSKFLHNKAVVPALQQTAQMYQNGGWRGVNPNYGGPGQDFGSSQEPAPAAASAAGGAAPAADPMAAFSAWKAAGKPQGPAQ